MARLITVNTETCKSMNISAGSYLIKQIIHNRFLAHKNTFILLVGDTGDGKSWTGAKIAELIEPSIDFEKALIYKPIQYKNFMELSLEHRNKYKVAFMDEAHTSMPARRWFDFCVQAITTSNAVFRQLKQIVLIMSMPSIRWLELLNRELINYYGICSRSSVHSPVYMRFYRIKVNREDIERSQLYKARLKYFKDGRLKILNRFAVVPPSDPIIEQYEKWSRIYKAELLKDRLFKTIEDIEKSFGAVDLNTIADFYLNNKKNLEQIISIKRPAFKDGESRPIVNTSMLSQLHPSLKPLEIRNLGNKIYKRLIERGLSDFNG